MLTRVEAPGGPALPAVREGLDWLVGIVTGIISFAVYAWSAAPNVTLLDSGEFIVAAQHFGYPTGLSALDLSELAFPSPAVRQRRLGSGNL